MFAAPPTDIDVVGWLRTIWADPTESLVDIARRRRLGQDALRRANPDLPRWLPLSGAPVTLPLRHVLPATAREGLVVNLPERRLYDFTLLDAAVRRQQTGGTSARIASYPVSIGRVDWETPLGDTRIVGRRENPVWIPPASIREEAAARGQNLPAVVPAGPDNPLGRHALYLDRPGYLLHGTNNPDAIGLSVTHGCIRLYPADIAALYRRVPDDTRVRFIDQAIKLGWQAGRLYLEAHPPLDGGSRSLARRMDEAQALIARAVRERPDVQLEPLTIRRAIEQQSGLPTAVTHSRVE